MRLGVNVVSGPRASFRGPALRSGSAAASEFHSGFAGRGYRSFLEHPLSEGSVLVAAGFLRKICSEPNSNLLSIDEVLYREKASASRRDA